MRFEGFDNAILEHADIDLMHEKALKVMKQSMIDERDFIEPYGAETVERDLKTVAKDEAYFKSKETPIDVDNKKIADIFEALVLWNGEQSNWLGENAVTMKTSRYDDYENGVDAVIEFQGDEPRTASHMGLAADVTFSTDTSKKFDRIRKQIDDGRLAKVKYFHSEHMNIHGQLSKLPEIILGADKKTVLEVAELWAEKEMKKLAEHRMQIMLLLQAKEQLTTFALYAESIDKSDIAAIYRDRLQAIEGILEEKRELANMVRFELNDMVHEQIMGFMKRWQKELRTSKAVS